MQDLRFLEYQKNYTTSLSCEVYLYIAVYHAKSHRFTITNSQKKGCNDYACAVDGGDLQFCTRYAKKKPQSVPSEFTHLAQILMEENDWNMPSSCEECLVLYLNLKSSIEELYVNIIIPSVNYLPALHR